MAGKLADGARLRHRPAAVAFAAPPPAPPPSIGKKNPFPAEMLDTVMLNGEGSAKETLHLEFSLAGSGLTYEPGDALAVIPVNAPDVVKAIIQAAKLTGNEEVEVKNVGRKLLADALREDFDITALSRAVLTKLAEASDSAVAARPCWPRMRRTSSRNTPTAARSSTRSSTSRPTDSPPKPRRHLPQAAAAALFDRFQPARPSRRSPSHGGRRPLPSPRPPAQGRLLHLSRRPRETGRQVPVFVQPNKNFRLPADGATPVIMVGPGTGVAPFRAFVEHRAALGSHGQELAVLRRPALHLRLPLSARVAGAPQGRRAHPPRRRLLPRPAGKGLRPAPHDRAGEGTLSPGLRKAPISMSAATPTAWPTTSTKR